MSASVADDLKELFAEARGNGLDTKALRAVFREQVGDKAALQEFDALCDLYRASLNAPRAGRARESQSYAEAKGRDPATPKASNSKTSNAEGRETPAALTDTQEQPETTPAIQTPANAPRLAADDEAAQANSTSSAPISHPQPAASLGADTAGDVPPPSSPASYFNNPRCQHPDTCSHAHDQGSCDDCFFDWAKRPLEEQRRLWAEAMEAASETEAA